MKTALILTDGKAGHENQSRALARHLGCEAAVVAVRFKSRMAKSLSYLLDRLGVRTMSLFEKLDPVGEPAVVIGTGSGTFYAVKALAERLHVPSAVVLYPRGYVIGGFSCVLAPSFDNPARAGNVIEIPANLVAADEAFYEKGVAAFKEKTQVVPEIGVIIGGPNKCATMDAAWMKRQLDEIFRQPGAKAVTTSRRTPAEIEALVDSYPWDYRLIYSRDHFNPIPAFVKLARRLYVTAESTGMISEACTCGGAEVVVLDNLNPGPHKFRRFVDGLRAGGYVDGSRKIDLGAEMVRARQLLGL